MRPYLPMREDFRKNIRKAQITTQFQQTRQNLIESRKQTAEKMESLVNYDHSLLIQSSLMTALERIDKEDQFIKALEECLILMEQFPRGKQISNHQLNSSKFPHQIIYLIKQPEIISTKAGVLIIQLISNYVDLMDDDNKQSDDILTISDSLFDYVRQELCEEVIDAFLNYICDNTVRRYLYNLPNMEEYLNNAYITTNKILWMEAISSVNPIITQSLFDKIMASYKLDPNFAHQYLMKQDKIPFNHTFACDIVYQLKKGKQGTPKLVLHLYQQHNDRYRKFFLQNNLFQYLMDYFLQQKDEIFQISQLILLACCNNLKEFERILESQLLAEIAFSDFQTFNQDDISQLNGILYWLIKYDQKLIVHILHNEDWLLQFINQLLQYGTECLAKDCIKSIETFIVPKKLELRRNHNSKYIFNIKISIRSMKIVKI